MARSVSQRYGVAALLACEIGVLCLLAFTGVSSATDGLVVRSSSASIQVLGQSGPWDTFVVNRVTTPVPAWVVVQALLPNGQPGVLLGYSRVPAGSTEGIRVALDPRETVVNTFVVSVLADRGRPGVLEIQPPSFSGQGGMGMGASGSGGKPSAVSTFADKPLLVSGQRLSLLVTEVSRSGMADEVHRVVQR